MSLKWTYILIGIIYVVLIVIALLNKRLEKQWLAEHGESLDGIKIWRNDFFTSVGIVAAIGAILINILCLIGGRGLNVHSIIITIFLMGMMYISNRARFFVSSTELNIGGHYYKKADIEKISCKKKNGKMHYHVFFKEPIDGYNYTIFYASLRYRRALHLILEEYPVE